jgi:hypothetical protein
MFMFQPIDCFVFACSRLWILIFIVVVGGGGTAASASKTAAGWTIWGAFAILQIYG